MKLAIAAVALALVGDVMAFFRMPCRSRTGLARMDPLMDPGEVSDHVHTFHGGGNVGMITTYDTLTQADGNHNCTSCEVVQDKSVYWTPVLYFIYDNGTTVLVEQVGGMLAYYLFYLDNLQPFPEGFRMIAGDKFFRNFTGPFPDTPLSFWPTDPTDQFFLQQRAIGFNCLNYQKAPEPSLYRHRMPTKEYLDANCADGLRLELAFPSCGNGSLDSADHKSHMKYPSLVKEGNCPAGYDTHYPFLFFETIWATDAFAGEPGSFVLSYGDPVGTGYHGDFIMGWTSSHYLGDVITTCTAESGEIQDCPLFDIQSDATAAQCTFPVPDALQGEDVQGPRDGLPVNVPLQYGPQQATAYPVAGQSGVPTSSLAPTSAPATFSEGPTLSYSPADAASTSTAQGGIVVAMYSGGADRDASTTASSSATTITQAPSASSLAGEIVSTGYTTSGHEVVELIVEKVDVTVTATATEGVAKHRRHLQKHVGHAKRW